MGKKKDRNLEKLGDEAINQISELSGVEPKVLKKRGKIESITNVENLEKLRMFFQAEQIEKMKKIMEANPKRELKVIRVGITSSQKTRFSPTSNLINQPDRIAPVFQIYPDLKENIVQFKVIKVKLYGPTMFGFYKIKCKADMGRMIRLFKNIRIDDYDISRVSGTREMYQGNFNMVNSLKFDEMVICKFGIDENSSKAILQFHPILRSETEQ